MVSKAMKKTLMKRLNEVDEKIKEVVVNKNHSKYSLDKCPHCKMWEELIIEKKELVGVIFKW